jgi:mycothiol system anti-sigma-R factor
MKHFLARMIARLIAPWARTPQATQPDTPRHTDMPAGMTPMLDCESVMRQLWDYLDGELSSDRMAAIRAHLELCKRCYPQYEFERSFLDAIAASAPQHSNLDRLRAQLTAALEAKGLADG